MVYLGLCKGLSEEGSLKLHFELWHSGEISRTGAQITFQNLQKLLARGLEGVWCLTRAEQSWGVRGECAVEMTVCKICYLVLTAEFYRQPMQLAWQWCYVMSLTSLWNKLCCTVLNPLQSVLQADQPRPSCRNQSRLSGWTRFTEMLFERYRQMNLWLLFGKISWQMYETDKLGLNFFFF